MGRVTENRSPMFARTAAESAVPAVGLMISSMDPWPSRAPEYAVKSTLLRGSRWTDAPEGP
jgi:hypothetical protein